MGLDSPGRHRRRQPERCVVRFFLGTHRPNWLWQDNMPELFVSHRTLQPYRTLQPARTDWALDSGGFTELSMHGGWQTTQADYIAAVRRYAQDIGRMQWAAPQDWMCEPWLTTKTGLTVLEHQRRTIKSVIGLRDEAPELPWVPVLQGWDIDDYQRHVEMYGDAGIDLRAEPTVGLGSVCRRQATSEIGQIVEMLDATGLRLHGFGVKMSGVQAYGLLLKSADSLAWSFGGRKQRVCPESPKRKNCGNCLHHALSWRQQVISRIDWAQPSLFGVSA